MDTRLPRTATNAPSGCFVLYMLQYKAPFKAVQAIIATALPDKPTAIAIVKKALSTKPIIVFLSQLGIVPQ